MIFSICIIASVLILDFCARVVLAFLNALAILFGFASYSWSSLRNGVGELWEILKKVAAFPFSRTETVHFRQDFNDLVRELRKIRRGVSFADEVQRGDSFIDKLLLDMILARGDEYDPYYMEDSVIRFNRRIGFVNVSGEVKFHDGYITGLKTLHRPDHCSLREKNGRLYVKADLAAGVLNFHYPGSVKLMNFGPTITLQGTLSYVEVFMEFDVDANTGLDGKLTKFKIDDLRGMKVWVTGLGPFNWAVNPIFSAVGKCFNGNQKNCCSIFLEKKVERHIAEHLSNFKFPVEDVKASTTEETSSETTPEKVRNETATPEKTEAQQCEDPGKIKDPMNDMSKELETAEEPVSDTKEPLKIETSVAEEPGKPVVVEVPEKLVVAPEKPVVAPEKPVVAPEKPVVAPERPVVVEVPEKR